MKKCSLCWLLVLLLFSCTAGPENQECVPDLNYRAEMRRLVTSLSEYGKTRSQGFLIIPQNGQELVLPADDGEKEEITAYLNRLDGTGREDLNYGYTGDNRPTPEEAHDDMLSLCRDFTRAGKTVLVTDYCRDEDKADSAYQANGEEGFLSFAADDRNLAGIPSYPASPRETNSRDIYKLEEASNFLYLINDEHFSQKADFLTLLGATDYDILIIDLFCAGRELTEPEIDSLKTKAGGGKRLVLAYMSIGEAEDYRWYWEENWSADAPSWLEKENPRWKGNYTVRYWEKEWKNILMGSPDSYMDRILSAGFDGVYLDIIDAFEYFESL